MKRHFSAVFFGGAYFFQFGDRFAALVLLAVNFAVFLYFHFHVFGQSVYAGHTHAVQAAGYFISAAVKLAAGVQNGHHHFQRAFVAELGVFGVGH